MPTLRKRSRYACALCTGYLRAPRCRTVYCCPNLLASFPYCNRLRYRARGSRWSGAFPVRGQHGRAQCRPAPRAPLAAQAEKVLAFLRARETCVCSRGIGPADTSKEQVRLEGVHDSVEQRRERNLGSLMDASSRPNRVRWPVQSASQRRNYTSSVVQAITSIAEIRVRLAARLPNSARPCSCHERTSDRGAERRCLGA